MKDLRARTAFKRDLKRVTKRDYDIDKLAVVIEILRAGDDLPETYRDHALKGDWGHWRECHIAADWLLIYKTDADQVVLGATGTHADLFK